MTRARTRAPIRLRHSPGLDGLRALAVAAVVLYHAGLPWLPGGFLGVDVFFVLSGFLITSLLLTEWRRGRRPRIAFLAFWQRRARRILPALYVVLAAVLVAYVATRPHQVAAVRKDALAAFAYVANWWFIFGSQPYFETAGRPSPFLHLWSLGVEEQFYLLWPLLFVLAARLRRLAPWLVLFGAAASSVAGALLYRRGVDPSVIYYGTGTHAGGLLLGGALAFWWTPGRRIRRGRRGSPLPRERLRRALTSRPFAEGLLAACIGGLVAAFVLFNQDQGLLYQGGLGIVAVLTAGAIVAVTHPAGSFGGRILQSQPVRWLGLRSYGVYLWHWPVLVLAGFPRGALAVAAIATALVLAETSYLLVEMPIRRRGFRWLVQRPRLAPLPRLIPATAGAIALITVVAEAQPTAPPAYLAQVSVDTIQSSAAQGAAIRAARAELADNQPLPLPSPSPSPFPALPQLPVIAVGDSVMVGAAPALERSIPGIQIDAREGRQVQSGLDDLAQLAPSRLDGEVVVDLGNNGTFTGDQLSALMKLLSGAHRVVFVNLKEDEPWTAANNQLIADAARTYGNAVLVNWVAASTPHPEYFWDDGLHLRPQGAAAYAQLILAALMEPR